MLELKNITKKFGNTTVLNDISLTFHKGQTTVILGPSGSGKSTLLRTIDLLETPDAGTITIANINYRFPTHLTFQELKAYRNYLSIVFQSYNLFPHMTVLQNVMSGPIFAKKMAKVEAQNDAEVLLQKVGLLDKMSVYPKDLSGGQMQRVAIARALIMNPTFMLYDEPTSSLDPELAQEVLNVIKQLADDQNGQIIVTHHIEFAKKIADRILFLDAGRISFDGPSRDFFESSDQRIQKYLTQLI